VTKDAINQSPNFTRFETYSALVLQAEGVSPEIYQNYYTAINQNLDMQIFDTMYRLPQSMDVSK